MKNRVGFILFLVILYVIYFCVLHYKKYIQHKLAKEMCSKYFTNVDTKYTQQEELFPPKNKYNCTEILSEHESDSKFCNTERNSIMNALFFILGIQQLCEIKKYKSYNEKYITAVNASSKPLIPPNLR